MLGSETPHIVVPDVIWTGVRKYTDSGAMLEMKGFSNLHQHFDHELTYIVSFRSNAVIIVATTCLSVHGD